ncbi:hypothetical protein GCM10017781_08310 [Deinococcus metalli]|uniref:PKD domain-containing protein n=1 Tax=Deinococcus metalli TaxID=1141878 RepID=A0ABQ3JKC9_9DEIO|nr:hypothetical protein GCM10017781_08310 [Deinococcus metalli]
MTWTAASGATGYTLERRSGTAPYVPVASPDGSATTYTDTGLSPSTAYTYHLRVTTAAGTSPYSTEASATTPAPDPAAPTLNNVTVVNGISGTPERVTISGTASTTSGTLQGVTVDWGETGSTPSTASTGNFTATHDYQASGTYTVKVTATDSSGRRTTDTRTLNVTRFQTGSQAHFVFDGNTFTDLSGNKRSGTYAGSGCLTPVADRYTVADRAERFNDPGAAACTVSVSGGGTTAPIPLPGEFSVNVWVRPDSTRLNRGGWLTGTKDGAFSLTLGTDGRVTARLAPASGAALNVTDPTAITGNAWTQYVAILSGSPSILGLYRDGVRVAQASASSAYVLPQGTAAWTVADAQGGTDSGAGSSPFSGSVDDLRLYNRALQPYEVSALYTLDRYPKP